MASLAKLLTLATALVVCEARIDTHHHAIPPAYAAAIEANGGDGSGFPTPEWSLDMTVDSLTQAKSSLGILSVTAPSVSIVGTGEEGRELTRTINDYFEDELSGRNTTEPRLGFFGTTPDWQDVDGVLAELDYLFTEQRLAWGVVVMSSYGDKLLGDALFEPIWERLNEYKALVFVHPTELPGVEPQFINGGLPSPIVDFPLATTRAAVDLVFTGTIRRNTDVDVILSHAGGAIPFVGSRAISSLVIPAVSASVQVNLLEAQEDFARFYYDIALSTSAAQLNGLLDFTEPSQVLFGTDFPYAPQFGITALLLQYESFVATNPRGHLINDDVLHENALRLLRKHLPRGGNCTLSGL